MDVHRLARAAGAHGLAAQSRWIAGLAPFRSFRRHLTHETLLTRRHILKSLRAQLVFFFVMMVTACTGLALIMVVLFRDSAGAEIDQVGTAAEQTCSTIAARYAKSLATPLQAEPQLDLLQVVLQLVLLEMPRVEGGVWQTHGGFLAYAYPTYEGSSVKRDVPQAEQAHIAEVAQLVARTQEAQTDVVRASRDALIVSACPLQSPGHDLVAWTMTRVSLATLDARRNLRLGLGGLLAFVMLSAAWLGAIMLRGYRHIQRLEAQLSSDGLDVLAEGADERPVLGGIGPVSPVGVAELDRLVAALNLYRSRLQKALERLQAAERQRARDQRLAALGRMTGSVAHEIRNPIAAMRLKAENALAGHAGREPDALRVILGQIDRLEGLVQSLLAVVQPINLTLHTLDLAAWLAERASGFGPLAESRGVRVICELPAATLAVDPRHLGRAIDNLLDNAVRHARTTVTLSLRHETPQRVVIRVQDDGEGVSPAMRDVLFEPFSSGRPDGTGLGLALAHEVALAHGGDLRQVDLHDAPGACFELELPWRAC